MVKDVKVFVPLIVRENWRDAPEKLRRLAGMFTLRRPMGGLQRCIRPEWHAQLGLRFVRKCSVSLTLLVDKE